MLRVLDKRAGDAIQTLRFFGAASAFFSLYFACLGHPNPINTDHLEKFSMKPWPGEQQRLISKDDIKHHGFTFFALSSDVTGITAHRCLTLQPITCYLRSVTKISWATTLRAGKRFLIIASLSDVYRKNIHHVLRPGVRSYVSDSTCMAICVMLSGEVYGESRYKARLIWATANLSPFFPSLDCF